MKQPSLILTSILLFLFMIKANADTITYEDWKKGNYSIEGCIDFYNCPKDPPRINCAEEINKLYDMDNFDWNEQEWKNPQAFQDYLDKAFNNPVDPEFKKKCLKEFTQRNDMIYDAEKDHITWKRVCDTFHPCKSH